MLCPSDPRGAQLVCNDGGNLAALTDYLAVNGRNQFKESRLPSGRTASCT